jgi:hypothetical protein
MLTEGHMIDFKYVLEKGIILVMLLTYLKEMLEPHLE